MACPYLATLQSIHSTLSALIDALGNLKDIAETEDTAVVGAIADCEMEGAALTPETRKYIEESQDTQRGGGVDA